jgi:hypothetical protein
VQITTQLIEDAVRRARRQVLDLLEIRFGQEADWLLIRQRVLKIFGTDGLQGAVTGKAISRNGDGDGNTRNPLHDQ